jgi:hypothetical protein
MTNEQIHKFRKQIDACINVADDYLNTGLGATTITFGREMSLVKTKLQEAKMWAGKCLEANGAPFPENLRDKATL